MFQKSNKIQSLISLSGIERVYNDNFGAHASMIFLKLLTFTCQK